MISAPFFDIVLGIPCLGEDGRYHPRAAIVGVSGSEAVRHAALSSHQRRERNKNNKNGRSSMERCSPSSRAHGAP